MNSKNKEKFSNKNRKSDNINGSIKINMINFLWVLFMIKVQEYEWESKMITHALKLNKN